MKSILEAERPGFVVVPADRMRLPLLVQNLSLDVALGVLCAGSFAATLCRATMPPAWWLLLPLSAWVVYAFDHLLDGRRPEAAGHSARHRFFARHGFRVMPILAVAIAACALLALAGLSRGLLIPGSLVALAAAAYLAASQTRRIGLALKELIGALLFVVGIWFGPLLLGSTVDRWVLGVAGLHFLAAWLNLVLFALIEAGADRRAGHVSIVTDLGRPGALGLLIGFTVAGTTTAAAMIALGPERFRPALFVIGLLVLLPGLLWWGRRNLAQGALYRWLGDGAFLLMAIPWLLERPGAVG